MEYQQSEGGSKMTRTEKALQNQKKGYNCAQAIVCTFSEMFGIDEKTAFRISECFGSGMGIMDTCGAVSAMAAVIGMKESDGNLESPATKKICYSMMKTMVAEFKEKNGSTICREIKGIDTGTPLRSCTGCIEDAVAIIERNLLASG
jgi:C_GCAxxG_C_C family probable redox protein